jgi:Family of unknown function (DUF6299)
MGRVGARRARGIKGWMMRTMSRALLVVAAFAGGLLVSSDPAAAAPPANDVQAGAVLISGIPFSYSEDTTEATSVDAGELVASQYCAGVGAPAFEHAVWFKAVTSGSGGAVVLDASQSDYGTGIAVLEDVGGQLVPRACAPSPFLVAAGGAAGTFYILVFGDGTTTETSGNLVFTVDTAPPPPIVAVTIDPVGTATKDGSATISGTLTCSGSAASPVSLFLELKQTVGRLIITSFVATDPIPCDGTTHDWQASVPASNGKFSGGKAEATVQYSVCSIFPSCSNGVMTGAVKLNRGGH